MPVEHCPLQRFLEADPLPLNFSREGKFLHVHCVDWNSAINKRQIAQPFCFRPAIGMRFAASLGNSWFEENRSVLVIDDDRPVTQAIAELLETKGYEVEVAYNEWRI